MILEKWDCTSTLPQQIRKTDWKEQQQHPRNRPAAGDK